MWEFLGTVFIAFLVIVLIIVFAVIGGFIKVFRAGSKVNPNNSRQSRERHTHNDTANQTSEKQFPKEEGEYVDFEEIKDNDK